MERIPVFAIAALVLAAGCTEQQSAKVLANEKEAKSKWEQLREDPKMQKATFGAGCFWGVEHIFREIKGVKDVASGYAGGHTENPTYQEVCTGTTGHAEVIEVIFDPEEVSYEHLLDIFFRCHDATQLNYQGPDVGTQYRSAIFFHSPEQEKLAKASKEKWDKSGKFNAPVVTEIAKASTFYRAEEYHQQYYAKTGGQPYCHFLRPE